MDNKEVNNENQNETNVEKEVDTTSLNSGSTSNIEVKKEDNNKSGNSKNAIIIILVIIIIGMAGFIAYQYLVPKQSGNNTSSSEKNNNEVEQKNDEQKEDDNNTSNENETTNADSNSNESKELTIEEQKEEINRKTNILLSYGSDDSTDNIVAVSHFGYMEGYNFIIPTEKSQLELVLTMNVKNAKKVSNNSVTVTTIKDFYNSYGGSLQCEDTEEYRNNEKICDPIVNGIEKKYVDETSEYLFGKKFENKESYSYLGDYYSKDTLYYYPYKYYYDATNDMYDMFKTANGGCGSYILYNKGDIEFKDDTASLRIKYAVYSSCYGNRGWYTSDYDLENKTPFMIENDIGKYEYFTNKKELEKVFTENESKVSFDLGIIIFKKGEDGHYYYERSLRK